MPLAQQDGRPLVEFTLAPLFEDYGIPLAVMGVLVVFVALALIVAFINLLRWLFSETAAVAWPPPASDVLVDPDEVPEETLVVIAAAVSAAISQPHRIVRIRGLTPAELGWSLEGRTRHHQSHRIPHRDRS